MIRNPVYLADLSQVNGLELMQRIEDMGLHDDFAENPMVTLYLCEGRDEEKSSESLFSNLVKLCAKNVKKESSMRLFVSAHESTKRVLARNINLSNEVLVELILGEEESSKIAATYDMVPLKAFWEIDRIASHEKKVWLAKVGNLPVEALLHWAKEGDLDTCIAIAGRSPISHQVLEKLAYHPSPDVRLLVIRSAHVRHGLLSSMANHPDPSIRLSVATYCYISSILNRLTQDADLEVAERAKRTVATGVHRPHAKFESI